MKDDPELLRRLAEAVADGRPVDWKHESDTHTGARRRLEQLQVVEAIAGVHAPPPAVEPPPAAPPAEDISGLPTESAPGPPPPPTSWGPLRIVERIGRGGFGEVFRAHDPNLDRMVALKLLRPDLMNDGSRAAAFLKEARLMARVRHDNVVVVHGADRHDGRVGIWMELIDGQTLEELLRSRGRYGPEEAVVIGREICRAVAAVHAQGLIHRDIKTSNVMRNDAGRYILMDFGAMSELSVLEGGMGISSVSGTPLFMGPEQLEGTPASVASDIYSIGVVLYRLVTGSFPVEAGTLSELRERHDRGQRRRLLDARPDLPSSFASAVEPALEREAAARYTSVGEMERALAADEPVQAVRPPTPVRMLAAALILALAIIAVLSWRPWVRPLDVEAAFFRAGAQGAEPLDRGATLRLGDAIYLEIEGSTDMYVYILDEDDSGKAWVLFPLPGAELQNPLEGGVVHRLPGRVDEQAHGWEVSSAGGRESLFVIASRRRIDPLERVIAEMPYAGGPAVELDAGRAGDTLRGIGGLTPLPPGAPEGGDARKLAGVFAELLSAGAGERADLWLQQLELSNPG